MNKSFLLLFFKKEGLFLSYLKRKQALLLKKKQNFF